MTIRQWLSFQGQIGRKTFWLSYWLPCFTVAVLTRVIDAVLRSPSVVDASWTEGALRMPVTGTFNLLLFFARLVDLLLLWPSLAGATKRLHDRGRSGWWVGGFCIFGTAVAVALDMFQGSEDAALLVGTVLLIAVVALIGYWLWLIVEIGFLRGTPGPNRYGPDPLGGAGGPAWQQQPMVPTPG